MQHKLVLVDADELSLSTAMTPIGAPTCVEKAESCNGGWVCSQNSSVNADQASLADFVNNYAAESGGALLMFGNALCKQWYLLGFGENVGNPI